jgi:hypothetical protein
MVFACKYEPSPVAVYSNVNIRTQGFVCCFFSFFGELGRKVLVVGFTERMKVSNRTIASPWLEKNYIVSEHLSYSINRGGPLLHSAVLNCPVNYQ